MAITEQDMKDFEYCRRDAMSIASQTTQPSVMAMIDRLRIAGYDQAIVKATVAYVIAAELGAVIAAMASDKEDAERGVDYAMRLVRQVAVDLAEESDSD